MANDPVMKNQELEIPQPAQIDVPANKRQITISGISFIILGLFLAYCFLVLWPTGSSGAGESGNFSTAVVLYNFRGYKLEFSLHLDKRLLLLVMIAGATGSFIHIATSFSDYVGNERLSRSWLWWYALRPLIGMTLAVVFYVVVRGGLITAGTQSTADINPFGVTALAGLVGMFSKQATDKLNEVFDTLFKTDKGDAKRKNSLENPVPVITDVNPKRMEPKTSILVVSIIGSGFVEGATVMVNGINRETIFIDRTQLTATLLPEDVDKEGELELTVFNPRPGGGRSIPIKLKIAGT